MNKKNKNVKPATTAAVENNVPVPAETPKAEPIVEEVKPAATEAPKKEAPKTKAPIPKEKPKKEDAYYPVEDANFPPVEGVAKATQFMQAHRMSPDGMVQFSSRMYEMYGKGDNPVVAGHTIQAIAIMDQYLLNVVAKQIGEDAPALGLIINPSQLNQFKIAAEALSIKMNILPEPKNDGQLEIQFDENTIPAEVTEGIAKGEAIAEEAIDTDLTKLKTQD